MTKKKTSTESSRLATTDIYGRTWPSKARRAREFCPVCGQPLKESLKMVDSTGPSRCYHYAIPDDRVKAAGGIVPRKPVLMPADIYNAGYNPNEVVYLKRRGRYVAMGVRDHLRGEMNNGHYLMTIYDGGCHYSTVEPAWVEVEAALQEVRTAMEHTLSETNKARPDTTAMKGKEIKAWKEYCKILGNDGASLTFRGCSMHDLVQAGLDVVRKHLKEGRKKVRKKGCSR